MFARACPSFQTKFIHKDWLLKMSLFFKTWAYLSRLANKGRYSLPSLWGKNQGWEMCGAVSSMPPGHALCAFPWDLAFFTKLESPFSVALTSSPYSFIYSHKEKESALIVHPVRKISRRDFIWCSLNHKSMGYQFLLPGEGGTGWLPQPKSHAISMVGGLRWAGWICYSKSSWAVQPQQQHASFVIRKPRNTD